LKKIQELGQFERPREKLIKRGAEYLSYSELMSVIIGSGTKDLHVRDISTKIVSHRDRLLSLNYKQLIEIPGVGINKALSLIASRELFIRLYKEQDKVREIFISSPQVAAQMVSNFSKRKQEYLICLYLNSRRILLKKIVVTKGTLDLSIFHAREVFYPAIKFRAASFILVHNHPSGDVTPSREDLEVTKDIEQASKILGIPLIDHIIISNNRWGSILKSQYGNIF
jgi:DNA repair protein RadC